MLQLVYIEAREAGTCRHPPGNPCATQMKTTTRLQVVYNPLIIVAQEADS